MALRGQRFELDLDADEFTPKPIADAAPANSHLDASSVMGEIQERDTEGIPPAPKLKVTKTGFPEHRKRDNVSRFKRQQENPRRPTGNQPAASAPPPAESSVPHQLPPSDKAIVHQVHGYEFEARQKAEISDENKRRIAEMSAEDIADARAALMASLDPALIEKFLKRATLDDHSGMLEEPMQASEANTDVLADHQHRGDSDAPSEPRGQHTAPPSALVTDQDAPPRPTASIHFPTPPIDPSTFVPLDPSSPSFLADLRTHYFPNTPHDPSTDPSMTWLTPPTEAEDTYSPNITSFAPSTLRFSFTGELIRPELSATLPVSLGLHHHGHAPASAGYTIPELAMLARSTLPNQRCLAYLVLGRILFRLGRGDFGPRGGDWSDGLWNVVEQERVIEALMAEANRQNGGHASAKAYATEALWLWRRGGGGDRGILKEGEKLAK